jgi:hypothetical protein
MGLASFAATCSAHGFRCNILALFHIKVGIDKQQPIFAVYLA